MKITETKLTLAALVSVFAFAAWDARADGPQPGTSDPVVCPAHIVPNPCPEAPESEPERDEDYDPAPEPQPEPEKPEEPTEPEPEEPEQPEEPDHEKPSDGEREDGRQNNGK